MGKRDALGRAERGRDAATGGVWGTEKNGAGRSTV